MTPEQFTYWLQGFVELNKTIPTEEQWKSIKDHLSVVFTKVTPPMPYVCTINEPVKLAHFNMDGPIC